MNYFNYINDFLNLILQNKKNGPSEQGEIRGHGGFSLVYDFQWERAVAVTKRRKRRQTV